MLVISILAIYALSFALRNLSGPWNIFGLTRNWVVQIPQIGTLFFELLSCPWCIGFHCGYVVYIISFHDFSLSNLFIWALAGSAIVAFGDTIYYQYDAT